jgi:hypothetical protein
MTKKEELASEFLDNQYWRSTSPLSKDDISSLLAEYE